MVTFAILPVVFIMKRTKTDGPLVMAAG